MALLSKCKSTVFIEAQVKYMRDRRTFLFIWTATQFIHVLKLWNELRMFKSGAWATLLFLIFCQCTTDVRFYMILIYWIALNSFCFDRML
jgi:hypothetical protein